MGNQCPAKMIPGTSDRVVTEVPYGQPVVNPFTNASVTCPKWWGGFMYPGGCCAVTDEAKATIMADPRVEGAADDDAKHCAMLEVAEELQIFAGDKPSKCGSGA